MPRKTSYDSKCYDLAEAFIEGDPDLKQWNTPFSKDLLAQAIQETIEDFLAGLRDDDPEREGEK